ncbi:MAG: GTPase HflX [Acidobacteriia bacterium]|nr:GTPase HflX [Terriglobia bacterium]
MNDRALLVSVCSQRASRGRSTGARREGDDSLDELQELAFTAGAEVVGRISQSRPNLDPAFFIGRGKGLQLREQIQSGRVTLLIFDDELTPTQQRNLENLTECRVIDRTQLILAIFAQRARTREGKLQVELAQLDYLRPRLTGHGVELSRLGGGIGTRGPGETRLEMDRRRIIRRIARIRAEMERVRFQRELHRRHRRDTLIATLSLVGYTNAGKSTLFNALTDSDVGVSRQLFSTLDPTLRKMVLPSKRMALLSDTVGFIRKLPHTLVTAFRATLEEVVEADLILHVIDRADPQFMDHEVAVNSVLEDLQVKHTPILKVYNKTDLLEPPTGRPDPAQGVFVSALTGEGLEELVRRIDAMLLRDPLVDCHLVFPHAEARVLSLIQRKGHLLEKEITTDLIRVHAQLPQSVARQLTSFVQ